MYRIQHESAPRRGLILLVVLFLLTLFAIAGISMVLYADAEAGAARLNADSASFPQPDMEPELAFSYFLGQLLYDCLDDETGIYSALRGHSLMRNLYGLHTELVGGRWELRNNYVPYHGPGRLHTGPTTFLNPYNIDDFLLPNYMHHPADDFLRDPERYRMRQRPSDPRGPFIGSNVGYTYPDLNTLFLAAARADGTVLMPSFFRPYTPFGPLWVANSSGQLVPNPNWFDTTNRALKYMVLRPRPADHLGFPPPEDATGDVKNWPWAPGGNDSIWIDIDAPVLRAPDGRKYKMLVAPLIIDLDSRLNVNVAGNVLGVNFDHRSNQGFGPWEINPGWVLNHNTAPDEWKNLIRGRPFGAAPEWLGRYGANRQPRTDPLVTPLLAPQLRATPHRHAALDFDGRNETDGQPTGRLQLPAPGPTAFSVFPTFPPGYGNGSTAERTHHPSLFNPSRGASWAADNDDRVLGPHNMAGLLRVFDTGSEALHGNDLIRLLPLNLNDRSDPVSSARRRRMLTTTSFDLDRPGFMPWVWDRRAEGTAYRFDEALGFPRGPAIPFPDPIGQRGSTPTPATATSFIPSEFNPATWQSVAAALGRLNLNRALSPYPAPDATTGRITDLTAFQRAHNERKALAQAIFDRLQIVAGTPTLALLARTTPEFRAMRWLAQLAVNIVDYIDEDDYITIFNWSPASVNSDTVFGTELSRLVLNEAYAQQNADPEVPTRKQVNVWVELHNPFYGPPNTLTNGGDAVLQFRAIGTGGSSSAAYAAYQVVLTGPNTSPPLRAVDNVTGSPSATALMRTLTSWGADPTKWVVQPSNGNYSGPVGGTQGFYVVGSNADLPVGIRPMLPTTFASPSMSYPLGAEDEVRPPTILLRRLACPHLPPNASNSLPEYNPYITVDYLEDVPVNDATTVAVMDRVAWGKNQPFASHISQRVAQAPAMQATGQPKHTFYRHNAVEDTGPPVAVAGQTLKVPFDWLVHLDRQLVSPVELLHVSAFKPHELTQQFVVGPDPNADKFRHYAPWFRPEARISRLFGLVDAKNRLVQITIPGGSPLIVTSGEGRIPGRINLNTVFDYPIFQALCDVNSSNSFTPADVQDAWQRLMNRRTPTGAPNGVPGPVGIPGATDRPLLDPGTGFTLPNDRQFPLGISLDDTLLSPGLFFDPASTAHPYLKYELLNKIWNNVTVRSNVFAVWLTVGFFEVMDDSSKPVKLGQEIGRAENRHVRHRMFAVVDRTQASASSFTLNEATPAGARDFAFSTISQATPGGLIWQLTPGIPIVWEPDTPAEETSVITRVDPNHYLASDPATLFPHRVQVVTTLPHRAGSHLITRGNPGPWPGYDPRRDRRRGAAEVIVPYWAIID